jgi:tetratricopeptide (TPR) repeat protein
MECLCALLAEHRFLLVLDGAERLLRAYARMDAPYLGNDAGATHPQRATYRQCADPNVGTFLQWLAGLGATKTLLTTRLLPCELEGLAGMAERKLTRMDPQDAVRFFRAMNIQGTRAEIRASCKPYGYLPLALRLLAGLVAEDPARPGDVAVATEYEITKDLRGEEQHHILERAYDALDPAARQLLSLIAAFRSPVGYGVLQALFGPHPSPGSYAATPSPLPKVGRGEGAGGRGEGFRFPTERALKDTLRGLVKRGLLLRQEGTGRYDLHPVVRRYAYDRLADKEGIHTRLRDYFAAVPPPEQVESLDDLAPTIELYHHTVRAGRYDEACDLFYDRLGKPLYFRFGAYQLRIKLLHALFPGGEPFTPSGEAVLPRLSKEAAQAWTLNELANSYSLSGQPGRAVPLFEKNAEHDERHNRKTHLATGLGNLATQQLAVGALAAAEGNLRRRIVLCQEIGDEFREAVGHQELGRLLAYTGAFEMAGAEIQASITYCEQFGHQQGYCQNMLTLTLRALLMGRINELTPPPPCTAESGERSEALLPAARRARELADVHGYERDIIRAEWLLGAAHRAQGELAQAEPHLAEALRRCRRINLVEMEPDILLELARLRYAQMVSGSGEEQPETLKPETKKPEMGEALSLAKEALDIAERCDYRLVQADAHLILAQLALSEVEELAFEAGDLPEAHRHAEAARDLAWCDGPPHRYEAAFLEAERLLEQIEAA